MSFRVRVDVTNPGQFFACCGLFELAGCLDPDTTVAHFEGGYFVVGGAVAFADLLRQWTRADLRALDAEDETASPLLVGPPFDLRLDWWKDETTGGRELKVWAGSMRGARIARAMITAVRDPALHDEGLLDAGRVVHDPAEPTKKVEPFYFDARRAANAHARDLGFAPNDLDLTTIAFPATEALCLIGLQRCRPAPTQQRRIYDYCTWSRPVPLSIISSVVAGAVQLPGVRSYRFEVWYRTGQKKHKAFRIAIPIVEGE